MYDGSALMLSNSETSAVMLSNSETSAVMLSNSETSQRFNALAQNDGKKTLRMTVYFKNPYL